MMDALASAHGGARTGFRVPPFVERTLLAFARENAVEGCVFEAWGAVCATFQAQAAREATVRAVMAGIAEDETRHAELAFEVARFVDTLLDAHERAEVETARVAALQRLARDLAEPPAALILHAGLPTAAQARALLAAARPALDEARGAV